MVESIQNEIQRVKHQNINEILLAIVAPKLRCILNFKQGRDQRKGSEFFLGNWIFMRWFPVAFLTNGVFIVTHGGFELTTPAI